MKKIFALLFALLLVPTLAFADACRISADGTATITAQPDIVSIEVNGEVNSESIADAQRKLSDIVASATKALLDLGIEEDSIVTTNYSFSPTYDYSGDMPRQTGYSASHTLRVTCKDIEKLDAVLSAVTDSGMTQVYGINFDVSNRAQLYRDALALAVEAAGEKAAKLAEPLGLTVLEPVSVSEVSGYDYGVYANAMDARVTAVDSSAGAGIRSGDISVTAKVTVSYDAQE